MTQVLLSMLSFIVGLCVSVFVGHNTSWPNFVCSLVGLIAMIYFLVLTGSVS